MFLTPLPGPVLYFGYTSPEDETTVLPGYVPHEYPQSDVLCQIVISYINSHAALVITIVLIMFQDIDILEQYIF